jgi:Flp pilus assembly protein TadG
MRRLMADQRERETGATAVIVALCFLLLLGLVGLSIDIGAAFAKRQEMQNAADAAALAVAAECLEARVAANCPGDYAAANEIALLNERTGDSAEVRSGEGAIDYARPYHVTVTVTGEQPHWFLQAVGGEDSTTVRRSATVNFGSPVKGTVTIPIIVSECVFQLAPPELGKTVEIWLPQNATQADNMACGGSPNFPSGGFGWLAGSNCAAQIGLDGTVESDTGMSPPNGCDKNVFRDAVAAGATAIVPLFEKSTGQGGKARYDVTRFVIFQLTGFQSHTGNLADATQKCRCQANVGQQYMFSRNVPGVYRRSR